MKTEGKPCVQVAVLSIKLHEMKHIFPFFCRFRCVVIFSLGDSDKELGIKGHSTAYCDSTVYCVQKANGLGAVAENCVLI